MIRSRPFLNQSFCVFAFLFGLALFTSKSLISLTTVVLLLLAVLDPQLRRIWSRNTWLIGLLCLFPFALFVNYFSLAGTVGVSKVTISWYWPLLAAPFFCIYQSKKALQYTAVGLTLGLTLALVNASLNLFALAQVTEWFQYPVENMRIASFWDLGRWGFFSGLAVLCLFCFVNEKLSQRTRILSVLLLLFTVCFFVLANARGPLVGLTVAVLLVAVTDRKIFKSACLLFLVFGLYYALNSTVASRMKSIFAVSLQPNQITSTDKSNAGRLQMWKVAFDFFR